MNNIKYDGVYYPVRRIDTLKEMIVRSAEMFTDKAAYLQKDKPGGKFVPVSYGEFGEKMFSLGTRMLELGLRGKKIAVIGESCYQWILTYFATVCGVGVIVPLDKNLPPEEIENLIKRSGASAIVYTKRMEKRIQHLFEEKYDLEYFISINEKEHTEKSLSLPKLIEEGRELLHQGIREYVDADIDPDQMATLMYTSGTTGASKGVMLSHRNIASNVYQMSKLVRIPEDGVVLSILPIHHAYEFSCAICTTFYQGKTIAICEGIKYIQKNMNEVHANIMLGVPLVFEKMYKGMWKQAASRGETEKLRKAIDLSKKMKLYNNRKLMKKLFKAIHQSFGNNISLFIAGGAAIDPKVIEDFEAMGLPMIQGYGMSECSPIIAVNQDRYSKAASVGRPMPGTEVKIVAPDEDGVGEVACRGASVMLGYYDNEEATAEVLRDGWLYTGDLGYFDEDGFLYLTGRKKTVIVTKGGKNIFPEEVETVLLENELVQEVIVYGVADERVGNIMVTADIYPNYKLLREQKGDLTSSEIYHLFKDIVDEANSKMPPYKNVKRINIRETEFDKTTTGKVKRYGNTIEKMAKNDSGKPSAKGREEEIRRAAEYVNGLKNSNDRFVRYKDHLRPVTDVKDMINSSAELFGDNVAFRQKFAKNEPYTNITYKQALTDINGLGTALINMGLKGDKIAIIGETCYQWESSYLAVTCGTGIAVPLDKELRAEELEHLVKEAEVTAVIFGKKYEKIFREIKESGRTSVDKLISFDAEDHNDGIYSWKKLIEEGKKEAAQGDRQFIDAKINPDEMGIILFTSGTTGVAKGVMLSHRNIVEDIIAATSMLKVYPEDIFFSVLPVHHTYECTCAFLTPLYMGASIAYCQGLKYIVKNMEEVRPTMLLAVPILIEGLYKKIQKGIREKGKEAAFRRMLKLNKVTGKVGIDISRKFTKEIRDIFGGRMRVIISGGAAIDPDVLDFFNQIGITAVQGYGLTECSPMTALNPDKRSDMRNVSAGHVLPCGEVKIADADEDGIGEICFRGGNIMLGYYNNPEATAEVIKDGWFHTGDLGYIDSEEFVYITGRKKNVIVTNTGKNIFPEELEYYLGKVPYILESMVWGEEDEDGSNDTSIVATVTLDRDEISEVLGNEFTDAQAKDLIWKAVDEINETLPYYKKIRKLLVKKDDFEKTTGKKIKRFVEANKEEN